MRRRSILKVAAEELNNQIQAAQSFASPFDNLISNGNNSSSNNQLQINKADKGSNSRKHRNSILSLNSSIMLPRTRNGNNDLPDALVFEMPQNKKIAQQNGKRKDGIRRCSLISIGQLNRNLELQDKAKSQFRNAAPSYLVDNQSQNDDLLSKAEPLPEMFVKQNLTNPKDRRRGSQLLGIIQKRGLPSQFQNSQDLFEPATAKIRLTDNSAQGNSIEKLPKINPADYETPKFVGNAPQTRRRSSLLQSIPEQLQFSFN